MLKKLLIGAALALSTLPAMASISIANSLFSYIGENGQFHRLQINTGVQLTTTNRALYSIEDISGYSFTITSGSTSVPLTTSIDPNGYQIISTIDESFGEFTPGTYNITISGLEKIKLRRLSDNQIVDITEVNPDHSTGRTFTYAVTPFETAILSKSYPNPATAPGECQSIGGTYTLTVTDISSSGRDFRSYDHDSYIGVPRTGWVENEKGEKICDAAYSCFYNNFSITPEKIITEPGSYYLIYPTEGAMNYYDANGSLSGKMHISHIKEGPYTVTGTTQSSAVKAQIRFPGVTAYSDNLPQFLSATFINASMVQFKSENDDNSTSVSIRYTDLDGNADDEYTEYTTDYHLKNDTIKATFPLNAYKGAGSYQIRWNIATAGNIEGLSTHHLPLDFSKLGVYSCTYTIKDPTPDVENIKIYRQAMKPEEFQIDPEQSISLRLNHQLNASGGDIYYRWTDTPSNQSNLKPLAESDDNDGFMLHTGDIEISSPGTLEYYTVHSNTRSEVKSVSFVAKPTSAIADINADSVIENLTDALPGLYSLSGVLISSNPDSTASAGMYLKVSHDGHVSKVIIR